MKFSSIIWSNQCHLQVHNQVNVGDEEEESTALKCILYLSQKNEDLIKGHIGQIMKIIENDMMDRKKYDIDESLSNQISNYYNALKNFAWNDQYLSYLV